MTGFVQCSARWRKSAVAGCSSTASSISPSSSSATTGTVSPTAAESMMFPSTIAFIAIWALSGKRTVSSIHDSCRFCSMKVEEGV